MNKQYYNFDGGEATEQKCQEGRRRTDGYNNLLPEDCGKGISQLT